MPDYEQHYTTEDLTAAAESPIDVIALKQVDMSVADYDKYASLEPDSAEFAALYERYGIAAGEPVIVSATDPEHPENNLLRVIATGDDPFTTNRLLTNQLEARLLEDDRAEVPSSEYVEQAPSGDTETLDGMDVTPEAVSDSRVEVKTGLTTGLVEGLVNRFMSAKSERSGYGRYGVDRALEAHSLSEAYRGHKISKEDMVVISGALLGSSADHRDIDGIFSMVRQSDVLAEADVKDLSTQLATIAELNSDAGAYGDRRKVGYIDSLIARAVKTLQANDGLSNSQHQLLVGLITGLSTQIGDRRTAESYTTGALGQLKRISGTPGK